MAYTKYSLTPANNNATPPDGAPEGMLPSAVNDTMRDMMAQIRDVGDGIRDGTYTMTAPVITGGSITGVALSGNTFTNPVITGGSINNTPIGGTTAAAGTFTSLSDSGNLTFTGTGNRITGDFSNATVANRLLFQTSTTNGNTNVQAMPNGTSNTTWFKAYNGTDPDNAGMAEFGITASETRLTSNRTGTGTYLPLTMFTGGSERLRIDTSGNVGIGLSSPASRLEVQEGGTGSSYGITSATATGGGNAGYGFKTGGTLRWWIDTIGSAGSESLRFYSSTASAERMRITSSGGVSIGTTTDAGAQNLFVNGLLGVGTNAVNGYRITTSIGTSDNSLNRHHKANSGGGTAIATQCTQTATGITTAKTIAGLEEASFIMVRGSDGGGNDFMDLLISQNSGTPTVITSKTLSGSPSARTYTISSFNLQLAMASGTYTTNTMWFQLSAR